MGLQHTSRFLLNQEKSQWGSNALFTELIRSLVDCQNRMDLVVDMLVSVEYVVPSGTDDISMQYEGNRFDPNHSEHLCEKVCSFIEDVAALTSQNHLLLKAELSILFDRDHSHVEDYSKAGMGEDEKHE